MAQEPFGRKPFFDNMKLEDVRYRFRIANSLVHRFKKNILTNIEGWINRSRVLVVYKQTNKQTKRPWPSPISSTGARPSVTWGTTWWLRMMLCSWTSSGWRWTELQKVNQMTRLNLISTNCWKQAQLHRSRSQSVTLWMLLGFVTCNYNLRMH